MLSNRTAIDHQCSSKCDLENNTSCCCFLFHLASDPDVLYEVPVGIVILLSLFYGSISIIAVIGNSLVIWIVATTRQMQSVTNLFIANLALADVVIGMFSIPFQVCFCFYSRPSVLYSKRTQRHQMSTISLDAYTR